MAVRAAAFGLKDDRSLRGPILPYKSDICAQGSRDGRKCRHTLSLNLTFVNEFRSVKSLSQGQNFLGEAFNQGPSAMSLESPIDVTLEKGAVGKSVKDTTCGSRSL